MRFPRQNIRIFLQNIAVRSFLFQFHPFQVSNSSIFISKLMRQRKACYIYSLKISCLKRYKESLILASSDTFFHELNFTFFSHKWIMDDRSEELSIFHRLSKLTWVFLERIGKKSTHIFLVTKSFKKCFLFCNSVKLAELISRFCNWWKVAWII